MTTATQPLTLASLLAKGQQILADQKALKRQEEADALAKRRRQWESLRKQAADDLGELVSYLPLDPPKDFCIRSDDKDYYLWISPFRVPDVCIGIRYVVASIDAPEDGPACWELDADRWDTYTITSFFRLRWESAAEPPAWKVASDGSMRVKELAEAVALAHEASQEYRRLEAEAKVKEPPTYARKKEATLLLTDAETDLVRALREVLAADGE